MKRREYLAGAGFAISGAGISLAGCVGVNDVLDTESTIDNQNTSNITQTGGTESTKEEKQGFELVELNAPKTVVPVDWWKWSATIKNYSDSTEVFASDILIYRGNDEWEQFNKIDFTIPANDERTFESPESQIYWPGKARYKIESLEKEFEIEAEIKELTFGETAELSNGLELTVEGIELFNSITHEDSEGEETTLEPEEGNQFGSMSIELSNNSDSTVQAPAIRKFFVWAVKADPYEAVKERHPLGSQWTNGLDDLYQDSSIDAGEKKVRTIGFEIGDKWGIGDLTVALIREGLRWGESTPHSVIYYDPAQVVNP